MRRMPPVHTPIPLPALLAGVAAAIRGFDSARLLARVESEYRPRTVLLTDSGTSALRLALESLRGRGRASVALPAYSCYDLLSAAHGAGVDVEFYDLDPATLGPERSSLAAALDSDVRAVVVVHLYGVPVDVGAVRDEIGSRDILLIEDAAQGVGGDIGEKPLGGAGDLGILSFSRGKGRTGGAGGALLVNTEVGSRAVAETASPGSRGGGVRELFASAAQYVFARPTVYGLPAAIPALALGETRYREPRVPHSMNGVSAAVLDAGWGAARAEVAARRACSDRYATALSGVEGVRMIEPAPSGRAGYLRFPVRLDRQIPSAIAEGLERLGTVRGYPRTLPAVHAEVHASGADRHVPSIDGAHELVETLWTLPAHRFVTPRHQSRIVDLLVTP